MFLGRFKHSVVGAKHTTLYSHYATVVCGEVVKHSIVGAKRTTLYSHYAMLLWNKA